MPSRTAASSSFARDSSFVALASATAPTMDATVWSTRLRLDLLSPAVRRSTVAMSRSSDVVKAFRVDGAS
jgi:hypothetical protein